MIYSTFVVDKKRFSFSVCMTVTTLVLIAPFVILLIFSTFQYASSERVRLESRALDSSADLCAALDQDILALVTTLKSIAISFHYDRDLTDFTAKARQAFGDLGGDLLLLDSTGQDLLAPASGRIFTTPSTRTSPYGAFVELKDEPVGKIAITDLLPSMPGYGRRVALSIVVTGPDEQLLRLVLAIEPAHFASLLLAQGLGAPYREAIVDRSGAVLAVSTGGDRFVGRTVQGVGAMQGAPGQVDAIGIDGAPMRRFYRRSAQTGWFVLTSITASSLHAPLWRSFWLVTGIVLLLLFVVVPAAALLTRRMRNATAIATESARQLASGRTIKVRRTGIAETDLIQEVLAAASVKLNEHAESLKLANRDLEERVAARSRELAASHVLTKSILANSPDTIEVLDNQGRFVFTNNKGYRAHRTVELASGAAAEWPGLWQDGSESVARDTLGQAQNGVPSRFTGLIADEAGQPRWYDVLVTPMIGSSGNVQRILVVSREITARYLRDQELQDAKERAEAASVSKAEFLASMSHELRTPLNGILGYADLLTSDRRMSPLQLSRTQRIQEAALGLLHLVNDILDFAKIEAGEMALRPHPILLRDEIDSALSIVMPLAQAKSLILSSDLPADMPSCILADAERLRQVLLNLLSNAVKFTETGTVSLSARLLPATAGNPDRLAFAVRDTGIGIPPDLQPLLFRRFSQIDASNERRFGGTGLGLAICRHLVEQMGGSIEVESEAGQGATFRFSLPCIPARMAEAQLLGEDASAQIAAHVLVVEDNKLNRSVVNELLASIGCTVDLATSGQEAIEAVQRTGYDLVLMDDQMPGMSGITATRAIRSLDHPAREVVIVGCSANVFAHQIRRCEDAGMNGFVAKPLTRASLRNVFARHVPGALLDFNAVDQQPSDGKDGILDWLSDAHLEGALRDLRQELEVLRDQDGIGDASTTAQQAHRMISSAFVLQQNDLAMACRAFEEAHASGTDIHEASDRMRSAVDRALGRVDALLARLENREAAKIVQEVW